MTVPEKLIVSLTSWNKRINNVVPVLKTIVGQTIQPNKIIVNLCTDDFPGMENDLPEELLDFVDEHQEVEIYWFLENYKAWKKHLHALDIAADDDLIVCMDDDHLYPSDWIEKLYVSYCYYGKKYPVTANKVMLVHNFWSFNGPGTLYRKSDWGNYKKYLTHDILFDCAEDIFINIIFAMNNVVCLPILFSIPDDKDIVFNDNDSFTDFDSRMRHNASADSIKVLYDNTYNNIESCLKSRYFTETENLKLYPSFWNILNDCAEYYKKQYDALPFSLQWSIDKYYDNYLDANLYDIDHKSISLDIYHTSDCHEYIGTDNKLIVTISSWNKRINNVAPVLKSILSNTVLPDEIIINLARPDFDIPIGLTPDSNYLKLYHKDTFEDIVDLMESHPEIHIYWYDDADLKSWKKHIYVIHEYNANDVIICIDDDIIYSEVFIETMLKSYNYYGREFPITSENISFCHGMFAFNGNSSLYRPKDFKNFDEYTNSKILHMLPEDNHLLNILHINNVLMMPVIGRSYLFKDTSFNSDNSNFGNYNFDESWWNSYYEIMAESENIISDKCKGRDELKFGWNPSFFSFAYANALKFLNKHRDDWTEGPKKLIYDAIAKHVESDFGNNSTTGLQKELDKIIV